MPRRRLRRLRWKSRSNSTFGIVDTPRFVLEVFTMANNRYTQAYAAEHWHMTHRMSGLLALHEPESLTKRISKRAPNLPISVTALASVFYAPAPT
jgi:hypothetical protein